jgi:hypothetical protein
VRPLHPLALALFALAGCTTLGPRAALSLACPESQIVVDGWTASGCGKTDAFHYDDGEWVSLRDRAAFDLECDRASLEVVRLSSDTFGVTGCGERAAYKRTSSVGFVLDFNATPARTKTTKPSASSSAGPETTP